MQDVVSPNPSSRHGETLKSTFSIIEDEEHKANFMHEYSNQLPKGAGMYDRK